MVLDYKFFTKKDLLMVLKSQVPYKLQNTTNIKEAVNTCKETEKDYVFKLLDMIIHIDKITGMITEVEHIDNFIGD